MDEAYQQHSPHSRRHSRSATSLNTLSLAPLTSKLPIDDTELSPFTSTRSRSPKPISYIEQRHVAPNTGILSRPSSRSSSRAGLAHHRKTSLPNPGEVMTALTKSKSSTHIHISPDAFQRPLHHMHKSGAVTPGPRPTYRHGHKSATSEDFAHLLFNPKMRDGKVDEDDWLLRTGSRLTHGARESKGQAWLVSRASSTSLTNQNQDSDSSDDDDDQRKSQEDRISSFLTRRRESGIDEDDQVSPVTTRSFIIHNGSRANSRYNSVFNSRAASRVQSRTNSRLQSRRGSKVGLALTPGIKDVEREDEEGYFDAVDASYGKADFVGLDEEEEEDSEARVIADELAVRRLAKTPMGLGSWVEKVMGWSLFATDEDNDTEDEEAQNTDTETEERSEELKEKEREHWRQMLEKEAEEQCLTLPPPPKADDQGGWSDAAWLLSIATKVLL